MDAGTMAAIAEVFSRHGVTELWMLHDEAYPSEAVFMVSDAEYPRAAGNAALLPEVAALLPRTKLGLTRYTDIAPSRRLLPRAGGDSAS